MSLDPDIPELPPILAVPLAAQTEPPPLRRRNWWNRHWRGELPLVQAFWVNNLAISAATTALSLLLPLVAKFGDLQTFAILSLILNAIVPIIFVWQRVGLWRSAARHNRQRSDRAAGILAQIWVVLSAVALVTFEITTVIPDDGQQIAMARGDPQLVRFETVMLSPERMLLRGNLQAGCHRAFETALAAAPRLKEVTIESTGGRIAEGQRIAADITHRGGITTGINRHAESAATLVYLSGAQRLAGGKLGFHSGQIAVTNPVLLQQMRRNAAQFRFRRFPTLDAAEADRRLAADRFLADYEFGFVHGRYVGAALPKREAGIDSRLSAPGESFFTGSTETLELRRRGTGYI